MKKIFDINVLGTKYTVFVSIKEKDPRLVNCDGYIAPEKKWIVLDKTNVDIHQKHVLTHEIVHAFLYESGLDGETWAVNEEIVDWIALQVLKISTVSKDSFKKLKPFYTKSKEDNKE